MTLQQALSIGFTKTTDYAQQSGYYTRTHQTDEEILIYYTNGKRRSGKNYIFYLQPRYDTTRYCTRCYLRIPYWWESSIGFYDNMGRAIKIYGEELVAGIRPYALANTYYYSGRFRANSRSAILGIEE